MHRFSPPPSERQPLAQFFRDPRVFGALCGLGSAVGYTAANICLRAVAGSDPIWVSCVKAFPTVAIFGPWLLFRWLQGRLAAPPWRPLLMLVVIALICQLLGNVVFQWSLGVIGIALVVPLTLGAMIVSGALMGRIFLHEPVTVRMAVSILILILAVCVLSFGAGDASNSLVTSGGTVPWWFVAAGVAAACLSGLAYSALGVAIRYAVTDRISVALSLVTVTLTGLIALGALSLWSVGIDAMLATPPDAFWTMMLAGTFNAIAFLAITKSLQLIPVVYVNALNATQATLAAVAGVVLFAEPLSSALAWGVLLTVFGLLLMQRRRTRPATKRRSPALEDPAARCRLHEMAEPVET